MVPFGDLVVSGSVSALDANGMQRMKLAIDRKAATPSATDPKHGHYEPTAMFAFDASGSLELQRTVDATKGLVTSFSATMTLHVAEQKKRVRRNDIEDAWDLVAVRENQDADFRKRVADAVRRGGLRGCSLRLPGVVARPGEGAGLMSAFMSQLFWRLRDGEAIELPVRIEGSAWWISVQRCAANLRAAASADLGPTDPLGARRVALMPALWLSMQAVVDALARRFGPERAALVSSRPQERVDRLFAQYPPLATPLAEALGLRHDGSADGLVRAVLGESP
jgi:hypothetical protein